MRKIVFVGQTPPPFGGQAIMIEKILQGNYNGVKLYHVRLAFSKEMNEIGKANISKVFHLFTIIAKIIYYRITKGASILYYPPAGPDKVPVIRDILILVSTRWLFKKTIFHYHAGGLSEMQISSPVFKWLYNMAYRKADCAILLSELNPSDGKNLDAKKEVVIPYGIEDNYNESFPKKARSETVQLLFVAIIKESKGILVLLEACKLLKEKGFDFKLNVMGKFESPDFEEKVKALIEEWKLKDKVEFLGVLSGRKKFEAFHQADIFCFPTFFESETFGVVLLEAMQFSLPLVGTRWRGIPSIIKEGSTGYIVEPKSALAFSQKLELLIKDPELRKTLGEKGRETFLSNYSLSTFHANMENLFLSC